MNRLLYIIQKEFIQIFRNKAILPIMLFAPFVQLILLSYAADSEVENVRLAIVDQDMSLYSRQLTEKVRVSGRFILVDVPRSLKQADAMMQDGSVDIVLNIPPSFERDFHKVKTASLQLLVNAINGQQAAVGSAYLSTIIRNFNQEIIQDVTIDIALQQMAPAIARIDIENRYWYNPSLNFKYFMVPGILGTIVTILITLLTGMNIVREREIGTIEQINVTPIRKWQFILGKLIPFLIIGILLLTVGLIAGKLIFDVPLKGNLGIVFAFCVIDLIAILGLGFFISNISNTQQQSMFTTFFFVMIFILMSGLFTPIESMPKWAQYITIPNPLRHFVNVMRAVLLKGSGFADVAYNFKVITILAVVFNVFAVWSYRKVR